MATVARETNGDWERSGLLRRALPLVGDAAQPQWTPCPSDKPLGRASIWSVLPGWEAAYFLLFIIQAIVGIGWVAWREASEKPHDSVAGTLVAIWEQSAPIAITSAAVAIIITEIGGYVMVLARKLQEHFDRQREARQEEVREEGREQGLEQGRKEVGQAWRAWYERMVTAREAGLPFDEPPPDGKPKENGS